MTPAMVGVTGISAASRVTARCAPKAGMRRVVVRAGKYAVTLLPGDGIGPEIMAVAVDCLKVGLHFVSPFGSAVT